MISVIVPAYNHERFIDEALRSLAAQTYAPLELIVLDDGSTDTTFKRIQEMLPELEQRFTRVRIGTKPNEGAAKTISRCLEMAQSELVFMLDSDDVAFPEAIEHLLPYMEAPGVALAVGNNQYIDSDSHPIDLERGGERFPTLLEFHTQWRENFSIERDFGTYASLIGGNYIPNGWLFRRDCVAKVGGYACDFALDDWSLLLKMVKRYRVAYAGEILAKYRVHDGNMSRLQVERMFLDTARILIQEREYCRAHDLERVWWNHANRIMVTLPKDLAWKEVKQLPPPASCGLRIHLYALCWNDVRMLPFFLRHYEAFVERFVIFDDGSTDGSLELLRAHPRVEVRQFVWQHPESYVRSELEHYNHCWKESRGIADWVIVTDIDEHIFHPDIGGFLARCFAQGVTVIPTLGYEMLSEQFPEPDEQLCKTRLWGAPAAEMCKMSVFSPNEIRETNYSPGGHLAAPVGHVIAPPRDELLLLHYKLLGQEYTTTRHQELLTRMGKTDHDNNWAYHWRLKAEELTKVFESYRSRLVDISQLGNDPEKHYTEHRWWKESVSRLEDLSRLAELETSKGCLEAENAQLVTEKLRLEAEYAQSLRNIHELKGAVQHKDNRIDALESSLSWRITQPLRRVFQFASVHTGISLELINGILCLLRHPVHYLKQTGKIGIGTAIGLLMRGNLGTALKQVVHVRQAAITKGRPSTHLLDIINNKLTSEPSIDVVQADVIVPVYNSYELVVACIESVLRHSRNIRLMVVNDASTDSRIAVYLRSIKDRTDNGIESLIITNEANLGFVRSVNKAYRETKHHVVILNSDTEVPAGWLPRLVGPILRDERIATVTPFSNAATICSFPEMDCNNPLFKGLPLATVDDYFRKYGGASPLPLPTGVGFCMAVNRLVADQLGFFDEETFSRGYGEENDFCRRAAKAGYSNVIATNLFVYHKHGGSFRSSEKQQMISENHQKLLARHPEYQSLVEDFIREDPLCDIRETMKILIDVLERGSTNHIAIIDHDIGGGANLYRRRLTHILSKQCAVTTICYDYRMERCNIRYICGSVEGTLVFDSSFIPVITEFLQLVNVDYLFINELATWPDPLECVKRFKKSGIPYSVFMHDFFFVCPNMNLTDQQGVFCRYPQADDPCPNCLEENIKADYYMFYDRAYPDISEWRTTMNTFLLQAQKVVFFSENTEGIYSRFYPNLTNALVSEHFIPDQQMFSWRHVQFASRQTLNIAVIGKIGPSKGIEFLSRLIAHPDFAKMPVNVVVIGITSKYPIGYVASQGKFSVHGSYQRNELPGLFGQYSIKAALIPSVWPETFSYTTSEAILLGYPVICFDVGAPAERIKKYNCGVVVSEISAEGLLAAIQQIIANPACIGAFNQNAKSYVPPSEEKHFAGILELCSHKSVGQERLSQGADGEISGQETVRER